MDIFASINAGTYKNALPYARPKEDRAVFDAYKAEEARLFDLFVTDLRASLGMEPGPAFDALFAHAWEKGHSSGFSEVAIEAGDAADLLEIGAASERAACAELVRAAGCICAQIRYAWVQDKTAEFRWAGRCEREAVVRDVGAIVEHDPRCPAAILAAIEGRGRESQEPPKVTKVRLIVERARGRG
jgi:hypothetical protein